MCEKPLLARLSVTKMRLKILIHCILWFTLSNCSMKDKLTFFPDRTGFIPDEGIPDFASERFIETSDGENIQSFLFKHGEGKEKHSLIIYFHGNAGNLYHRFDAATRLYQIGQDVLLVSYRGYAKSSGKPNEEGIYIDGVSAVNYATDNLGYSENEITIFGRSLGSTVAVHIAQYRNFKNVVLIAPLTSGKGMATAMGLGLVKFLAGNSYNSLEKINNINSRMLIIHGDHDEVVPYFMGKQLFEEYHGAKQIVTIKNAGHNDLQEVDPELYWGTIEKFTGFLNKIEL